MRGLGQALVFLGVITGVDGIGIFLGSSQVLSRGTVALALSFALILGGAALIKKSKREQ